MAKKYKPSDMTNYYKRLDYDSSEWDFTSKQQLQLLMKNAGYRRKKDKTTGQKYNAYPTEKQLNLAWDYLIKGEQQLIFPPYEYEKKPYGYVALKDEIINNKKYRKGQFIPKPKGG